MRVSHGRSVCWRRVAVIVNFAGVVVWLGVGRGKSGAVNWR